LSGGVDELIATLARELGVEAAALLPSALLLAARLLPIAWLAPYVAPIGSPAIVRTATLGALTAALLGVGASAATIPSGLALWIAVVRELIVGLVIAIATSVPVLALEHVGRSLDAWRPSRGDETYARLFAALAAAAFVAIGGLRVVTRALGEGLVAIPLGETAGVETMQDQAIAMARIVATAITFTASLAAPGLVALFAAELGIALAARAGRVARALDLAVGLRGGLVLGAALLAIAAALPELPALTRWAIAAVPR
jgi:type III secretory pathway component EscT